MNEVALVVAAEETRSCYTVTVADFAIHHACVSQQMMSTCWPEKRGAAGWPLTCAFIIPYVPCNTRPQLLGSNSCLELLLLGLPAWWFFQELAWGTGPM